jgi:hemolysin activation/secretion protein
MDPTLPSVVPEDRKLVYPFLGIEILEDRFETTRNRDQIERTEDFLMGTRFTATLGWSDEDFGADRDAALFSLSAGRSYGSLTESALLLSGKASGRIENGAAANALLDVTARYYRQQSEKRTFFAALLATLGSDLDLDNPVELGGDTGLRGYPLRYQSGDSKILLTIEQRYFWDWYPLRLFRVGGAIFADTGRTWGDNPLGGQSLGWLSDVGFGLRLAPTRTGSRKMIHIDVAFPLNGDASIDNVQILLESKSSF